MPYSYGMGYGIDGIGYGSDQAFWNAFNSYNPNFRGTQSAASAASKPVVQTPTVDTQTIPAATSFKAAPQESDNTGMLVGGALATAATVGAVVYAAKRGNGEGVIAGIKNIFKGNKVKAAADAAASATTSTVKPAAKPLEALKIVIDKTTGRPIYYVPGKTTSTTDASRITSLLGKDKELKKLTGLRFNTGETTINGAKFTLKDGGNTNTIEFMNDKIVKITNGSGADITSSFVDAGGKLKTSFSSVSDTEFAAKIEEHIASIKGGNTDVIFNKDLALSNINYTTKIGDQSAEVFRNAISTRSGDPQIKKLTTLKEFSASSDEVLAYVRRAKADGNDISAIIAKDFAIKGKLPDGYRVGTFELKDGANILQIKDGEAVGITIGGVKYGKDSDKFLAYMEKHEKSIETMIKNALKDKKIPRGATIVPEAA